MLHFSALYLSETWMINIYGRGAGQMICELTYPLTHCGILFTDLCPYAVPAYIKRCVKL